MTRCPPYYLKYEKDPNFCGLCPSAVSQINSYLEWVSLLEVAGVDKKITYVKLTENAARPLFKIKDKARSETVKNLAGYLKGSDPKKLNNILLHDLMSGECHPRTLPTITDQIEQIDKKIEGHRAAISKLEQEKAGLLKHLPKDLSKSGKIEIVGYTTLREKLENKVGKTRPPWDSAGTFVELETYRQEWFKFIPPEEREVLKVAVYAAREREQRAEGGMP